LTKKDKRDNPSEFIPPDGAIASLARRLYPAILAYFESEEGQREFEDWKRRKAKEEQHKTDVPE
jgi:hypothetical protein